MEKIGAILIIGGGIAGIQSALDLAESGFKVHLVEKTTGIGGVMAQLDKTFPTNDCSMCILSPKLVEAGRHPNIELTINAKILKVEGEAGNFNVNILRKSLFINGEKCTGCGVCAQECPVESIDLYNEKMVINKATYVKYPQSVPLVFSINRDKCIGCGICESVCKAHAVEYFQKDEEVNLNVGAVILAPGFDEFDPTPLQVYGYGKYPNVVSSIEFERVLCASGPYSGMVLRPSDGDIPEKIAFLQCIGSRDIHHAKSYCSSVCCMYTAKEAVIAKEHQHQVNPTIFSMDIRAFGKDFDKYIIRAQEEYGIRYIRSRIASIKEDPKTHNLILTYESEDGKIITEDYNLVVLSVGLNPPNDAIDLSNKFGFELNDYGFCKTLPFSLETTTKQGIYVCGAFAGPKDIPDSVVQASAVSANVNSLLYPVRNTLITEKEYPEEIDVSGDPPRIGVFICHCGINIAGVVDVKKVEEYAAKLPNVVYVDRNLYTCSADTQSQLKDKIIEHKLNRVVIASCTPRTHEPLFQNTLREAGLNPYLFQMTNIRDQCSWVHMQDPVAATEKSIDLVHMAITRVRNHKSLKELSLNITPQALIIGGGVAGLTAALNLSQQGFKTYLIEKEPELGGFSKNIHTTLEGDNIKNYLTSLISSVEKEKNIQIFTNSELQDLSGYLGNFKSSILNTKSKEETEIKHGIIIVATGAKEYSPEEYYYKKDERVLTQIELENMLETSEEIKKKKTVIMIQCVGSRNDKHPYCSRVCCSEAIKNAIKIKKQSSSTEVIILYRDIRTYGFKEEYYREARKKGVIFIRFDENTPIEVIKENKSLNILFKKSDGNLLKIDADLIVLSTGMESPPNIDSISQMLKVPLNSDRFFLEAHVKLRPVDFATEGIFLCGTARGPANIEESVSQAKAASARAVTILSKEVMTAGAITSFVDENACTGCNICIRVCPYNAIEKDEMGVANVIEALCKGCGVCAASCPEKAILVRNFTKDQILSEIYALGGNQDGF